MGPEFFMFCHLNLETQRLLLYEAIVVVHFQGELTLNTSLGYRVQG